MNMMNTDKIKVYSRQYIKIYHILCRILDMLNLKNSVTNYRWGRRIYGGTWYLVWNWLPMNPFWSNSPPISCGSRSLKVECFTSKFIKTHKTIKR